MAINLVFLGLMLLSVFTEQMGKQKIKLKNLVSIVQYLHGINHVHRKSLSFKHNRQMGKAATSFSQTSDLPAFWLLKMHSGIFRLFSFTCLDAKMRDFHQKFCSNSSTSPQGGAAQQLQCNP